MVETARSHGVALPAESLLAAASTLDTLQRVHGQLRAAEDRAAAAEEAARDARERAERAEREVR